MFLFSNLKIHQHKKNYKEKPPLTPPRPPLAPPKEGNKKTTPKEGNKNTPPSEANNSPPSERSGVVSYRLAKRSTTHDWIVTTKQHKTKNYH
ncbi:MAG: hypothetical protein LBC74_01280 [Planctomycetaceae bacterium]|nr:hypothetical protein [Planctomycetaceae bacterium]